MLYGFQKAWAINRYTLEGSYQVKYKINFCYPAPDFIDALVNQMTGQGWKRLDFDSLNPKVRLNHARPLGPWSHIGGQNGSDMYQWIEDWEDIKGNVVRYWLKFQDREKVTSSTCDLEVVGIFIPAGIR